jgi:hypothetical protein
MTRAAASIALAALALAALPAHAINKCTDSKGKVSYVEGACPANSRQEKLTVMPGPGEAPAAPAASAAPGSRPMASDKSARIRPSGLLPRGQDYQDGRMDKMVPTLAAYEGCQSSPDFVKRGGPAAYERWRAQNAELLELLPRSPRYMKLLAAERQRVQYQLGRAETRQAFLDSCDALAKPTR